VLGRYVRRLLTPPLPGDGLLLVGFAEGVVGWGVCRLLLARPELAVIGLVESIVLTWAVLTAGIAFVGVTYTAPTVRRNRVWLVWGGLNLTATAINLVALAGILPAGATAYAYWHPWLAVMGVGYLATGLVDRSNPQIRERERTVYAAGGLTALGVLAASVLRPPAVVVGNPFLVGGLLHLAPIGYDVFADAALIAGRQ